MRARAEHEAVARSGLDELLDLGDDLACEFAIHVRTMSVAVVVVTEVAMAHAVGADPAVGEQLVRRESPSRIHEVEALGKLVERTVRIDGSFVDEETGA